MREDNRAGDSIQGSGLLSLRTRILPATPSWPSGASEKSARSHNLMALPPHVASCLRLAAFEMVSLSFAILITACLDAGLSGFVSFGTLPLGPGCLFSAPG